MKSWTKEKARCKALGLEFDGRPPAKPIVYWRHDDGTKAPDWDGRPMKDTRRLKRKKRVSQDG